MVARGLASKPKNFRFGRSWADGSSGGIGFVKFYSNLRRFKLKTPVRWEFMATRGGFHCGRLFWVLLFKVLEDLCGFSSVK